MTRNFWENVLMSLVVLTTVGLVATLGVLAVQDHLARQEPAPKITVPVDLVREETK